MEVDHLKEATTTSDTPVEVWMDEKTGEVIFQYGYVSVSMPVEDFGEFSGLLRDAYEKIEKEG